MRKGLSVALALLLGLFSVQYSNAANPKAGSVCAKIGTKQTYAGKVFTCVKSGKKLVWNNGVAIPVKESSKNSPKPTPSPTPTKTETTVPTPTVTTAASPSASPASEWKDPLDGKPCTNIYEKIPNQIFELVCIPYKENHPGSTDTTLYWAQNHNPGNASFPSPVPIPLKSVSYKEPSVPSLNLDVCKINENSKVRKDLPTGFPRQTAPTKNVGTIKWALIPVDFADMPGETDFLSRVEDQMKLASEWYSMVSGGKLKIEWVVAKNWTRLPGKSSDYKITYSDDPSRSAQVLNFWKTAITESDKNFDFTGIKTANFLLPKGQQFVSESGQGFPWNPEMKTYATQEGALDSFSLVGAVFDLPSSTYWSYWDHEFGHAIGIPHIGSSRISSPFQTLDLMGNQEGPSRDLSGWLRFVEGWLDDNQVYCQSSASLNSAEVTLVPLNENATGIKMAVVKVSDTKAVIVESRRVTKFGCTTESYREGVLVYTYDANFGHGEEFFTPIIPSGRKFERAMCRSPETQDALLRTGDKVTVDGITIEVTNHGTLDQIKISK